MDPIIWMYWEDVPGRRRPPYLDLCLESIRRQTGNATLRVLDPTSVLDWLTDIQPEVWSSLPGPTYRADYARTRLVHRYGGLWLDCDVIALSPLEELFEPLEHGELVGWGRDLEGRFYNNLFAARPGSPVVGEWIRAQDEVLRGSSDWASLSWAALGQDIVGPIARRSRYANFPSPRVAPVPWYAWRRLLSRLESPRRVLAYKPVTVMLWNSRLTPYLERVSTEELLRRRILLARLLRLALGLTTLERETDGWSRLYLLSDIRFTTQGRRVELHARAIAEGLGSRLGIRSEATSS